MRPHLSRLGPCLQFGAAALVAAAVADGAAQASIISPTPTLPPANGVYVGAAAPGCFPAVKLCVGPGSLAISSVVSSTFGPSGQDLLLGGVYTSALTDLNDMPLGTLTLTGQIDEFDLRPDRPERHRHLDHRARCARPFRHGLGRQGLGRARSQQSDQWPGLDRAGGIGFPNYQLLRRFCRDNRRHPKRAADPDPRTVARRFGADTGAGYPRPARAAPCRSLFQSPSGFVGLALPAAPLVFQPPHR